jgi:hypothetical protein
LNSKNYMGLIHQYSILPKHQNSLPFDKSTVSNG